MAFKLLRGGGSSLAAYWSKFTPMWCGICVWYEYSSIRIIRGAKSPQTPTGSSSSIAYAVSRSASRTAIRPVSHKSARHSLTHAQSEVLSADFTE